jgi:hypothetical protein
VRSPASLHQRGRLHNRLLREFLLTTGLLLVGLVGLPLAAFQVGGLVFGPYQGGTGGAGSFLDAFYAALGAGDGGAWLLVLSPLGVVTLIRVARAGLRRPARGNSD